MQITLVCQCPFLTVFQVFPRSWVPRLRVGDVAIGYPPIGFLLRSDLRRLAGPNHFAKCDFCFRCPLSRYDIEFLALFRRDPFITFHTGDDKLWTESQPWRRAFAVHNFVAAAKALSIEKEGEPRWPLPVDFVAEPFAVRVMLLLHF